MEDFGFSMFFLYLCSKSNFKDSLEKEIERDLKKKELCEANGIIIKYCVRKSVIKKYDIFNNKIYKNIYNQNNIIYA